MHITKCISLVFSLKNDCFLVLILSILDAFLSYKIRFQGVNSEKTLKLAFLGHLQPN